MPIAAAVAQAGLFPNLPKANLSRGSFFLQTRRFLRNAEFPAGSLCGAGLFCISRFGKAYFPRYWVSALHRSLRRAPLFGRCGFLRRPNPAAETSRVLWLFRWRFVSRWGGNGNIGGGNLSQGALAPSVRGASCARCAASQGLGNKIGLFGKTPVFWRFPEWALQAAFGEVARVLQAV